MVVPLVQFWPKGNRRCLPHWKGLLIWAKQLEAASTIGNAGRGLMVRLRNRVRHVTNKNRGERSFFCIDSDRRTNQGFS